MKKASQQLFIFLAAILLGLPTLQAQEKIEDKLTDSALEAIQALGGEEQEAAPEQEQDGVEAATGTDSPAETAAPVDTERTLPEWQGPAET
ncbi:MAG TPA: hypothetical protein VJ981_04180, partial [Gammaproteobacteria bacterium]|nr:hypothetical protein [Gammaproteobacteria bacterium]